MNTNDRLTPTGPGIAREDMHRGAGTLNSKTNDRAHIKKGEGTNDRCDWASGHEAFVYYRGQVSNEWR